MVFRANRQKTRQLAISRENPQKDEKRVWGIPASQPFVSCRVPPQRFTSVFVRSRSPQRSGELIIRLSQYAFTDCLGFGRAFAKRQFATARSFLDPRGYLLPQPR